MDLATNLHIGLFMGEITRPKSILLLSLSHLESARRLAPLCPETKGYAPSVEAAIEHIKTALTHLDLSHVAQVSQPAAPTPAPQIIENNEQA